jgi:hypothetical protein
MVRQECMEAPRSAFMKPLCGRQKNRVAPSYESAGGRLSRYWHKGAGAKRERSAQPDAISRLDEGANREGRRQLGVTTATGRGTRPSPRRHKRRPAVILPSRRRSSVPTCGFWGPGQKAPLAIVEDDTRADIFAR